MPWETVLSTLFSVAIGLAGGWFFTNRYYDKATRDLESKARFLTLLGMFTARIFMDGVETKIDVSDEGLVSRILLEDEYGSMSLHRIGKTEEFYITERTRVMQGQSD